MNLDKKSFSPFLEENSIFFKEYKQKTISILKDLILKTNKIDKKELLIYLSNFYDEIFSTSTNTFTSFNFISKLNNINNILNKTFLFLANNYIKYIFKNENSIEKLVTFSKLCDFYLTYLQHYQNSISKKSKLPNEILKYFSNAKSIIYLTVFKGIPISYKTYIKDLKDNEIEIKINSHQIISAKFQKQVYILLPDTAKTFIANIKKIKQNEKTVLLNNLSDIKRDKIKRNFIRVQPKEEINVHIKYKNMEFNGQIYDLSLRGLAVISNPLDIAISDKVTIYLKFKYTEPIKITTKAELVSITKIDKKQYKYHFYFVLPLKDEISLEKYICYREKEIINELNQYIQHSLI